MALDIVTYALCRKYTNKEIAKIISSFSEGMRFKGTVDNISDLPTSASNGDLYVIKNAKCKAVYSAGEWVLFDNIPTKVSELINDAGYAKTTDVALKADKTYVDSELTRVENKIPSLEGYATETWVEDKHYLTQHQDISNLATKQEVATVDAKIPTKVSQLANDAGYLTQHQSLDAYATKTWVEGKGYLTEHQSLAAYRKSADQDLIDATKQDKLTAGQNISIIGNVISSTGGSSKMGRSFTTKATVGKLIEGSQIEAEEEVADVLFKILYGSEGDVIKIYYGASATIPTDKNSLTLLGNYDVDTVLVDGVIQTISTGYMDASSTKVSQYPVLACDKGNRLVSLTQWSPYNATSIEIPFTSVNKGTYNLYYANKKTYAPAGTKYKFTFTSAT